MIVVPNTSDILMLKYILNNIAQDGGVAPVGGERLLKLYTNNLNPSKTTELDDLTEASETGYTHITLTGTNWTFSTSSGGTNSAVYSEQVFNFTEGVTVYGYYVTTNEGSPNLLYTERFTDGPYGLISSGGQISITPFLAANCYIHYA